MRFNFDWIQHRLSFKHWHGYPQFVEEKGLGRIALIASALSSFLTIHVIAFGVISMDRVGIIKIFDTSTSDFLTSQRLQMVTQWILYVISLCIFHLSEFFITALFNPSVVNASSFIINHSKAYTVAMVASFCEFLIRFLFFPYNNKIFSIAGLALVAVGQITRSLAMITCGESFNHLIQHAKKDTHVLVQNGIYQYLRHPSYFGFYYWSVGTQLLVGNIISTIAFAAASWMFFHRRIPYEEKTLMKIFPEEYPQYRTRTFIGIPFIKTIHNSDEKYQ